MMMPFNLIGFWNVRGSFVIFVVLWAMISFVWNSYYKKDSFSTTEYVGSFFIFIFIFLIFYWWNKILVINLDKSMNAMSRFKKVMDCSKEAMCIIKNSNL